MAKASASDFDHFNAPPASAPRSLGLLVSGVLSLGFVEGCLHVERRPIPLRFAIQYANANALPSVVWKTVPASQIAAACGLSHHTGFLVSPSAYDRSRRLIALKTVRCLRYAAASYGLVYCLWQLEQAKKEWKEERVVRVTHPHDSILTQIATKRHGHHIMCCNSDTLLDWSRIGLKTVSSYVPVVEIEVGQKQPLIRPVERCCARQNTQPLFVYILTHPRSLINRSSSDESIVLDALSLVTTKITEQCAALDAESVVFHQMDENVAEIASDVTMRLLHQHSIPVAHGDTSLHLVFAETAADAQAMVEPLVHVQDIPPSRICVVLLHEVQCPSSDGVMWLSIPTLYDDEVQDIRRQIRANWAPVIIQNDLRRRYGPQFSHGKPTRCDMYSDLTRFI